MPHPMLEAGARANLCFHDIADDPSTVYAVPTPHLIAVADRLRKLGIAELVRLYFDDGYASVLGAVEVLRHDYPEIQLVLALTLAFLDQPGFISTADVSKLHRAGAAISGHGREHLGLDGLSEDLILAQLASSREAFAAYGSDEFVLPYGSYGDAVLAVNARHRLFSFLTTTDYAWDRGQQLRPRLVVSSLLTPAEVCARLADPS